MKENDLFDWKVGDEFDVRDGLIWVGVAFRVDQVFMIAKTLVNNGYAGWVKEENCWEKFIKDPINYKDYEDMTSERDYPEDGVCNDCDDCNNLLC